MSLRGSDRSDGRFSRYVEGLAGVIGHADRIKPLRDYCTGLMLPYPRKSVEPMVAVTAPGRTAAQHQSLLHFVGQASWSDEKVLAKPLHMPVLPGWPRSCWAITYAHGGKAPGDGMAVGSVSVSKQVVWRFIPREGIGDLVGDPLRRWIGRHRQ